MKSWRRHSLECRGWSISEDYWNWTSLAAGKRSDHSRFKDAIIKKRL